jgi:hypothetical protein
LVGLAYVTRGLAYATRGERVGPVATPARVILRDPKTVHPAPPGPRHHLAPGTTWPPTWPPAPPGQGGAREPPPGRSPPPDSRVRPPGWELNPPRHATIFPDNSVFWNTQPFFRTIPFSPPQLISVKICFFSPHLLYFIAPPPFFSSCPPPPLPCYTLFVCVYKGGVAWEREKG